MNLRFGLQARFVVAMAITLALVFALLALLLQRQSTMQREVDVLGREAMQAMAADALNRRGEAMVEQLADALTDVVSQYADDSWIYVGQVTSPTLRVVD